MNRGVQRTLAVAQKEFRSEIRNRYGLNSMGMFAGTVALVVLFSVGREQLSPPVVAALLWISFFFMSVAGLSRTFLSEQERGTILLLRLSTSATPVFFGKLVYNAALAIASNLLLAFLFLTVMPDAYRGPLTGLVTGTAILSIGFAAAITIVSALLARASERGMLTAVLSLPLLLPLVFLGVDLLSEGAAGKGPGEMGSELLLVSAYVSLMIIVGYILFDQIWKE
jgi:heme exporter protein B